jgi:hypothetical protein
MGTVQPVREFGGRRFDTSHQLCVAVLPIASTELEHTGMRIDLMNVHDAHSTGCPARLSLSVEGLACADHLTFTQQ